MEKVVSFVRKLQQAPLYRPKLRVNRKNQIICQACEDLELRCIARFDRLIKPANPRWIAIHTNFLELETCAETGCVTCRVWRKLLLQQCESHRLAVSMGQSPAEVKVDISGVPHILLSTKTPEGNDLKTMINLGRSKNGLSFCDSDPTSDEVGSLVRGWFHTECLEKHWRCREAMDSGQPPRRLLEIARDKRTIRLINGEELANAEPYVALSYRWGTSPNLKTLTHNEATHRHGIRVEDLPKTIRDAVIVCGLLYVHYLWVDALCIIQDARPEAWRLEVANMHKVYGNAILTLAVCSSIDAADGFLQPRLSERLSFNTLSPRFAGRYIECPFGLHHVRTQSAISSRGWAFQEERLSPRILYWSDNGVFWSCQSGEFSEPKAYAHRRLELEPQSTPAQAIHFASGDWHQMIQEYARREFTNPTDRLPALSGLASKYKAVVPNATQCVAGHWLHHLPIDLLWRAENPIEKPVGKDAYVAPSWSWASVSSAAQLSVYSDVSEARSTVIDHSVVGSGTLRPDKASLTIRGRLRPLLRGNPDEIKWPEPRQNENGGTVYPSLPAASNVYSIDRQRARIFLANNYRAVVIFLEHEEIPDLNKLLCLEITRDGFLVVEGLSGECGEHRRVGCARRHHDLEFFMGAFESDLRLV